VSAQADGAVFDCHFTPQLTLTNKAKLQVENKKTENLEPHTA
jgi:hypothetical protein